MVVPVMKVWIVRMLVSKRSMFVPVRMRLCHRPFMQMLMMLVMHMAVFVRHCLVKMFVFVPFS